MNGKKFLTYFLVALVFGGLGYVLGNFFPTFVQKTDVDTGDEGGKQTGETVQLKITVTNEAGVSIPDLEVDVAEKPGQPPEWGVDFTDENGVAEYELEPGSYFVYFNEENFPAAFEFPDTQPVQVLDSGVTEQTVILHPAK